MRNFKLASLGLLMVVVLMAGSAAAQIVQMDYLGTGPQNYNYGGEYTYPYYFNITGTPSYSNVPLMCDDFNDQISGGQQWNAYVHNIFSSNNLFSGGTYLGATSLQAYEAAGLIFLNMLSTGVNAASSAAANWAIWGLFNNAWGGSGTDYNYYVSSGGQALVTTWLATAEGGLSPTQMAELATIVVYTPVTKGDGQEFFQETPEPGTIALFGTGLAVLGGALRRKLLV